MNEDADRFELLGKNVILSLWHHSRNKNIRKSTNTWVNAFKKWAQFREFQENITECEAFDSNTALERLYAEFRKKDGTEYEPILLTQPAKLQKKQCG